jgi:putative spermidine/putrescine transport system substrate-binding protein
MKGLGMNNHHISRRVVLKSLGAAATTLSIASLLSACKVTGHGAKQRELNFFGVGTLDIKDKWHNLPTDLGFTVAFKDNQNDVGHVITEMITMGASRTYDVGGLLGGAESELAQAKAILPWDTTKLKNYPRLWNLAKTIRSSRYEGQQYGIPIAVNADSMIYLPEKAGTVTSYHEVFNRKFKGKTSMEDSWMNSVLFTAIYLKESLQANIVDPSNLSTDELGTVMEFLTKQKRDKQFLKFWSGWEEGVNLIASGEVYVMTGWEPIVYEARRRGAKADYAKPKEGYEAWSTNLLLHAGAQEHGMVENAHAFADWLLDGYYGGVLATERGYIVPDDQTVAYARANPQQFTVEQLTHIENAVKGVQDKFAGVESSAYWLNVRPTNYRLYEDAWSRLRAS